MPGLPRKASSEPLRHVTLNTAALGRAFWGRFFFWQCDRAATAR